MRITGPRIIGPAALLVLLSACTTSTSSTPSASSSAPVPVRTSPTSDAVPAAVSGNECPQVFDASKADFYPIQPSFSAGYTAATQHLNTDTANWAYVIDGDFPYSNWMAWYLYSAKGAS